MRTLWCTSPVSVVWWLQKPETSTAIWAYVAQEGLYPFMPLPSNWWGWRHDVFWLSIHLCMRTYVHECIHMRPGKGISWPACTSFTDIHTDHWTSVTIGRMLCIAIPVVVEWCWCSWCWWLQLSWRAGLWFCLARQRSRITLPTTCRRGHWQRRMHSWLQLAMRLWRLVHILCRLTALLISVQLLLQCQHPPAPVCIVVFTVCDAS